MESKDKATLSEKHIHIGVLNTSQIFDFLSKAFIKTCCFIFCNELYNILGFYSCKKESGNSLLHCVVLYKSF